MKTRTALQCIATVAVLAIAPPFAMAQHAGFQIGIAQPTFGFPPTQAPAVVTRSTFVAVPTVVIPAPQPAFPIQTVFIPNQLLLPGQTVVVPVQPVPQFGRPVHPWIPTTGTLRHEVLRQLGQPSVTVITSTGETLYFTGGVTVIIRNGQVAGPR